MAIEGDSVMPYSRLNPSNGQKIPTAGFQRRWNDGAECPVQYRHE
jgi:hypothetical protein